MGGRMNPLRRFWFVVAGFLLALYFCQVPFAHAADIEVTSTPNPQGSGARANRDGGRVHCRGR